MISVLMSAYNETPEEISLSVSSILNQTLPDFEFIIVLDNPENTEMEALLERFAKTDRRIRLLKNEKNMGLAASLNRGLECCRGEYLARMDADDISLPERFEKELDFLGKYNLDVISCGTIHIDEQGRPYPPEQQRIYWTLLDISRLLRFGCHVEHPTILGKTDAFRRVGGYRQFREAQDYDLWVRMVNAGVRMGVMSERLLQYRIRSKSVTLKNLFRQFLTIEYIRNIYVQRRKTGTDNFSVENLSLYLESHGAADPQKNEAFRRAKNHYIACSSGGRARHFAHAVREAFQCAASSRYGIVLLTTGFCWRTLRFFETKRTQKIMRQFSRSGSSEG